MNGFAFVNAVNVFYRLPKNLGILIRLDVQYISGQGQLQIIFLF